MSHLNTITSSPVVFFKFLEGRVSSITWGHGTKMFSILFYHLGDWSPQQPSVGTAQRASPLWANRGAAGIQNVILSLKWHVRATSIDLHQCFVLAQAKTKTQPLVGFTICTAFHETWVESPSPEFHTDLRCWIISTLIWWSWVTPNSILDALKSQQWGYLYQYVKGFRCHLVPTAPGRWMPWPLGAQRAETRVDGWTERIWGWVCGTRNTMLAMPSDWEPEMALNLIMLPIGDTAIFYMPFE